MGPLSRGPGPLVETKCHRQTGDEALEGQGCPGRGRKGLPGETEMEGTSRSSEEGEPGEGREATQGGVGLGRRGRQAQHRAAAGPGDGSCQTGRPRGRRMGTAVRGFLRRDKGPKPSAGVTGSW